MRGIAASLLLLLLVSGVACVGQPLAQVPGLTHKYILDEEIPPAAGCNYLESESFTYKSPAAPDSLRVAELHLVGDTLVDEVVSFYKRQMELHDFEFVSEERSEAAHKVLLLFKRKGENEQVKIEIERKDTLVHIKINVYPT
jgi:hypothetical protein